MKTNVYMPILALYSSADSKVAMYLVYK